MSSRLGSSAARPAARLLILVTLGGAAGSAARYGVTELLRPSPTGSAGAQFPSATLAINVVGSFLLGLLLTVPPRRLPAWRYQQAFWGTGVLGGFTTFSTVMVDVLDLAGSGRAGAAFGYTCLTLAAGLLAAWLGLVVGQRSARSDRGPAGQEPA
jgi:fluoride exporter